MKVFSFGDLRGTDREVTCPDGGFTSLRAVLKSDGMGFGLHKTIIPAGMPQRWHYRHHLEACVCVEGGGVLTNLETGEWYDITPGCVYLLDKHDDHQFEAECDTVLISVFSPALTGREVHQEDRSYAAPQ